MRNWLGISGEEARGLQVTWAGHAPHAASVEGTGGAAAWPSFEPTRRAKLAARTVSGRARRHPEHRWRSQRNTGGAAAMRVCERPGGESPPPSLYTRLTCR